MGYFLKQEVTNIGTTPINVRCPECGQNGSFHGIHNVADVTWRVPFKDEKGNPALRLGRGGIRMCPNLECRALVFYAQEGSQPITTYPPEVLDFDATNLPPNIHQSLEEAVKAEAAECHRAAALMVRRVLEELCADQKAEGKDLMTRIAALHAVAVVPPALLEAANELRILGNDAAHVEAKAYDDIGKNEAVLAIELAKELLKAVYQYSDLLKRLQNLRNQAGG
jgi:hypothetical protein